MTLQKLRFRNDLKRLKEGLTMGGDRYRHWWMAYSPEVTASGLDARG